MRKEDLRIRDPFIFCENGLYYLLGSSGNDPWNKGSDMMLYYSTDLENFEEQGKMVDDDTFAGYRMLYAPEMHKYNGKYYLIISAYRDDVGRGSFILVSDSLTGKFKMLTGEYITPKGWDCLDSTLFVYEGKPYLYFGNSWDDAITGDGDGAVFVMPLSDDLTHATGKPKKITSGKYCGFARALQNTKARGYVAEAPWVMHGEDGAIVLLWSTFTPEGYCISRNISTTGAMGEYEFDTLVFNQNGGHSMVFDDLEGKHRIIFHHPNNSPNERLKIMDY